MTVTKTGPGSGVVTSRPGGIDCGSRCSADYEEGTAVTLTATADAGSTFDGWGGDSDCSDGRMTLTADLDCTADFGKVPPAPEPPKVIESVCLFASGSARVDNRCQKILDREVALQMRDEPSSTALIIGYSDTTGAEAVNRRLSQRRAEAVKQVLVTRHGIDADRITVEGRGETDEFGDDSTAQGRAENRRAVIRLTLRDR